MMSIRIVSYHAKLGPICDRIVERSYKRQIETGGDLLEAKSLIPHGKFAHWVKDQFGWSKSTANNYMAAAALVRKNAEFAKLQSSVIIVLAAPSTPEIIRAQVLKALIAGEMPTARQIIAQIAEAQLLEAHRQALRVAEKAVEKAAIQAATQIARASFSARVDEKAKEIAAGALIDRIRGLGSDAAASLIKAAHFDAALPMYDGEEAV